jgi:hypothetical protein
VEHLAGTCIIPSTPHKRIICAKFRTQMPSKEKEKKERIIRASSGIDIQARLARASDNSVHSKYINEEHDAAMPMTLTVIEVSPSTRMRSASFESERRASNMHSFSGSMVSSPTFGSFHGGKVKEKERERRPERENMDGDGDADEGEWVVLDMLDDDGEMDIPLDFIPCSYTLSL